MELLIVEDNTKLRAALCVGLESNGEVHVAHGYDNGEDALEFALDSPPDVILMDVQLAGAMNGIDALSRAAPSFRRWCARSSSMPSAKPYATPAATDVAMTPHGGST